MNASINAKMSRSLAEIIDAFQQDMQSNGITTNYHIKSTGEPERFHINGQKSGSKNGWCVLNTSDVCAFGAYGDWVAGSTFSWSEKSVSKLSPEEAERLNLYVSEKRRIIKEQKRKAHEKASKEAQEFWEKLQPAKAHDYTIKKKVSIDGFRLANEWNCVNRDGEIYATHKDCIVIDFTDVDGNLMTLQAISNKPFINTENKNFWTGAPKRGAMHIFHGKGNRIFIGEGVSTIKTIHDATGLFCVAAADKGNLAPVGKALRDKYPTHEIIFIADNDQFTENNPGITFANNASNEIPNSRVVYPEFDDLSSKPTDFNDLLVDFGHSALIDQLDSCGILDKPGDVPSVAEQPFFCLGYGEDKYYFYSRERKQVITRTAASLNESALFELAPKSFWVSRFPDKQDKYQKSDATNYLLRNCHARGLYDPLRHVRGRGAWIDQDRLVFHFGDHLNVNGERVEIEDIESKFVYECAPELTAPLNDRLTTKEGKELLRVASMFNWKQSSSALLLCGYIALAPLCGVLRWRPHIWVTGGAGSGKSTILSRFVFPLLGNIPVYAQGNSTEAGIRQTLKSDALPVVFDESESNNQQEQMRIQNLLAMIRQSSSDSAARTYKGTAGGRSMSFYIRSMFCLASIQASIQHQADMERITKLELSPKGGSNSGDSWATLSNTLYDVIERDESIPLRLFKRSIDLYPVIKANIDTFAQVAANMPQFGSQRKGDQYGTLLAGCWSLLSDGIVTAAQAESFINRYDWSEYQEGTEIEESEKALAYLLERKIRTEKGGEYSLYELIKKAHTPDEDSTNPLFSYERECKATIERYGMILHDGLLYISNTSENAAALFKNSVYEAGWKDQLLRADGVTRYDKTKRFNGKPSRCIEVNLVEIGVL